MKRPVVFAAVVIGLVVVCLAVWSAWAEYKDTYPVWQEEVQLTDGRIITVTQKHEYYENYGTSQSWVTFSLPEMGGERTWYSHLKPMRIDVADGRVYVFGRPRGDNQVKFYRWPRHFMVAFEWRGQTFERTPFLSVPSQLRTAENIFPCVPKDQARVITWAAKQEAWCAPEGLHGEFGREIVLADYETMARDYARRSGGDPLTD